MQTNIPLEVKPAPDLLCFFILYIVFQPWLAGQISILALYTEPITYAVEMFCLVKPFGLMFIHARQTSNNVKAKAKLVGTC